jgi:hypothetical protein
MDESVNDRTLIAPSSCQSEKSRNRMIWHAFRGVIVSGSETGMILRYCLLAQDGGKHVCDDETTTTMTLCIAEEKSSIPEIVNTHTNLANRMVDESRSSRLPARIFSEEDLPRSVYLRRKLTLAAQSSRTV